MSAPRPAFTPNGGTSWLDWVLDPRTNAVLFDEVDHARAELAELRKELLKVDASETKLITERDELSSLLRAVDITLGGDPNFAVGEEALERAEDAAAELAELRKERDELREAVLRLGELDCAYADGNEIYLTWWNTLVAKLRAEKGEAKATKETEP